MSPVTGLSTRNLLIALCATLGTATYAFTWNSVGVALPYMQGAFSATTDQITWVMVAFVIGSAVMTASVGWLSGRFGRRRIFMLALAGYSAASIGCGLATSLEQEVFWRFLQGSFGAALIPVGQAIAVNAFPPDRHGQASSFWALGFVCASVIAPTIGGLLIESYGWPWIYFVNVPVGLGVLVAVYFLVPDSERSDKPLDWIGFTSLILGVGALQLMLARGERLDWFSSTEIVIEAVVAASGLWVFAMHTLTGKDPFIDRALFGKRNYLLGLLFIFAAGGMLFLPLLLLPLLMQQIGGYPAMEIGYVMLPRGLGSAIGLILLARLRDRIDPRPILLVGLLLTAYSAWNMSGWTVEVRAEDVAFATFIQGLATGAVWAPINTLALSKLDKRLENQGYAFFYLFFDVGSAVGTTAVVGLHARYSQINQAILNEAITPLGGHTVAPALDERWSLEELEGLAALQQELTRQATMIAYNNSFLTVMAVMLCLIPPILLFRFRGRGALGRG